MSFPEGFVWGASSSAYQIEGAASTDGRAWSVWDRQCHRPGATERGDTGDVACDHYHRFREDVGLMRDIGLRAYRFSVAWPRVMPEGTGPVNGPGLDFYDALVDELAAANIEPYVTLYHWDLPLALFKRGGWMNRDIAGWFADYAPAVVERLSDRVTNWITINEPQCFVGFGYGINRHNAGATIAFPERLVEIHNMLRAHGHAARAIRAHAKGTPRVGWAPVGVSYVPASDAAADVDATRARTFGVRPNDTWNNTWYNDPIFFGRYPEEGLAAYGSDAPAFPASDMDEIKQPMDFLGINIYQADKVRAGEGGVQETVPYGPGHPRTAMTWPVTPEALYWGPKLMSERYGVPVYITENGIASLDWVHEDGRCRDPQRIDFTARYLKALERAIADWADVRGYFHWSILDNLEWADGFDKRFGLIHVDFDTLVRTPKDSSRWYARVIETNGLAIRNPFGYVAD